MEMRRLSDSAIACAFVLALIANSSLPLAAEYQGRKEGFWTAKDFRFHTGESLPELKIGYTTLGNPSGIPVLVLHGSMQSASNLLTPQFGDELFAAGQPLDASKFYIILPDAIGTGRTTKPSDGLRTKFPRYNYVDMVQAQHRLLTEGLGVQHVRLVMGSSMGGMEAWIWAEEHPEFMDAIVPLASTPGPMSGRNWLTRRLLIETIKRDPEYQDGNYRSQPASMKIADAWFGIVTNGGSSAYAKLVPNAEAGDKLVAERLNASSRADANDLIYQYAASADYNPWPGLSRIRVPVLAINAADDERNPSELGVMEAARKQLKDARFVLLPLGADSRGHGTSGNAKLWKDELGKLLSQLSEQRQ
jgi:homoserine O-acetyltransferase